MVQALGLTAWMRPGRKKRGEDHRSGLLNYNEQDVHAGTGGGQGTAVLETT